MRWFYGALFPAAYSVYSLSPYYLGGVRYTDPRFCVAVIPPYGFPVRYFKHAPDFSWVTLYGGSKVLFSMSSGSPLESLLDPMFDQTNTSWFGLYPQSFFNENFQPIPVTCKSA